MVMVFYRSVAKRRQHKRRFHARKDCPQLTKRPPRGEVQELIKIDLADLVNELAVVVPCRNCYPDAPKFAVQKRYCQICKHDPPRACAHNGGVPVVLVRHTHYRSLLREPGDIQLRHDYVWPQYAHHYYS